VPPSPKSGTPIAPAKELERFRADHARIVADWVVRAGDAYRLAPGTAPPISAEKVLAWARDGRAFILADTRGAPIAYGELNQLNSARSEYWLGHLIVDPALRGMGYGTLLVRQLLRHAFDRLSATRVSLVVFADNEAAVKCYKAAGMYPDGFEQHAFPAYGTSMRLLRMATSDREHSSAS